MKKKKTFQELEFQDAFMFASVMENPEICRQVLERILEIPIKRVHVRTENSLLFNSDLRGIRLDAYADDKEGTVFDVEMQTTDKKNLPKRSRFYQAQMDAFSLKPQEDFNLLPKSFVIFICTFDPFDGGKYRYTFFETCREDGRLLGDETCKVFLNTAGRNDGEVTEELIQFLSYVGDSAKWRFKNRSAAQKLQPADPLIAGIETRVKELKQDARKEGQYMLFQELLRDERQEGLAEGLKTGLEEGRKAGLEEGRKAGLEEGRKDGLEKGRNQFAQLISAMISDGSTDDLMRLSTDLPYREQMLKKYNLLPSSEEI